MTRERGLKGKESRERLLAVAAEEFASQGFHATKVSTIVARAKLTQPAFYLYFPSKEAIFDELVNQFRARLHTLIETSRLPSAVDRQDVPKRVLEVVELFFRFLAQSPHLTRIGLYLAPQADQIKRELVALVAANLRTEQQAGYFRLDLTMETVAECLVGMIERLAVSQLLPGIKGAETLANQVATLLLHGMLANEDAPAKDR